MAAKTDPFEVAKWGLLLAGGFMVYRIFQGTGLIKDAQGQAVENLNNTVDSKTWTKPTFWQQAAPSGMESVVFTTALTNDLVTKVYDSVGFFNDCEECIVGVLKQINYQTQYSWLAYNFYKKYGKDMTTYIKDAFNATELYPGWSHVESRPTYRKKQ